MDELQNGLPERWTTIDNKIIDDETSFEGSEKWTFVVLLRHAFKLGSTAFPSQKTLAKKVGVSDRQIRRHLQTLEQKGFLIKTGLKESTQTVIWRLVIPVELQKKWLKEQLDDLEEKQPEQKPAPKEDKPSATVSVPFKEIIDYLNEKAGKKFKHTSKANQAAVTARWKEGHRIDDFKHVIDVKADDWLGTEWENYLCPETLFRPSKFEKYLNQKRKGGNNGKNQHSAQLAKENGLPF
jgi:uncharacterized phage protein (TIGR02220 family)